MGEGISNPLGGQQVIEGNGRHDGSVAGGVSIKFRMEWTGARKPKDCLTDMRASYIRHYKGIREVVPEEQILEYKLSDGLGPLCKFLGKDVPNVPFPHVNDAAQYKQHLKRTRRRS